MRKSGETYISMAETAQIMQDVIPSLIFPFSVKMGKPGEEGDFISRSPKLGLPGDVGRKEPYLQ